MAREPFAPGDTTKSGKSQQSDPDSEASGAPLGQSAVVSTASEVPTRLSVAEPEIEIVDDGDKPPEEQDAAEQSRVDLGELKATEIDSSIGLDDLGSTGEDASGFEFGLPQRASQEELAARLGAGQSQDQGRGTDPGQGPDPKYGKDMISDVSQGGATPGSGYVFTDSTGEIKGIGNAASGDGMWFGVDVGAMKMEKEETQRAAEHDAGKAGGGRSDSGGGDGGGGADSGGGDGDGGVVHEQDNPDGSHTTTYEDGSFVTTYPDGRVEHNHPDGTTETDYRDGTLKTQYPDGSTETIHPDGSTTKTEPGEAESGASTPKDDNVLTPEEEAALREQLAPLEQHRGSQNDPGTETQPAEGDAAFGVGSGGNFSLAEAHERAESMFGQPGPGDTDFGSGSGGGGGNPSGDPNFGTIDPTDDADDPMQADGPEQDPFDRQRDTLEPAATGSEESESGSEGEAVALPPRTDLRADDPAEDLRRVEIDAG